MVRLKGAGQGRVLHLRVAVKTGLEVSILLITDLKIYSANSDTNM